jgi:hypothetical protein
MNLAGSASELATPKQVATTRATRPVEVPVVPAPPVAPSRALEQAAARKRGLVTRSDLMVVLVGVLCALIGVALSVWVMLP